MQHAGGKQNPPNDVVVVIWYKQIDIHFCVCVGDGLLVFKIPQLDIQETVCACETERERENTSKYVGGLGSWTVFVLRGWCFPALF